jgi:phosphoketolase
MLTTRTRREYSVDKGVEPDVVLVGIGFELTQEVIQAAALLRRGPRDTRECSERQTHPW